jgi:hypothetical protein
MVLLTRVDMHDACTFFFFLKKKKWEFSTYINKQINYGAQQK